MESIVLESVGMEVDSFLRRIDMSAQHINHRH